VVPPGEVEMIIWIVFPSKKERGSAALVEAELNAGNRVIVMSNGRRRTIRFRFALVFMMSSRSLQGLLSRHNGAESCI
jgi:hypothetical protein